MLLFFVLNKLVISWERTIVTASVQRAQFHKTDSQKEERTADIAKVNMIEKEQPIG